jgi:hypothetical protein
MSFKSRSAWSRCKPGSPRALRVPTRAFDIVEPEPDEKRRARNRRKAAKS